MVHMDGPGSDSLTNTCDISNGKSSIQYTVYSIQFAGTDGTVILFTV